ncbi:Outer membrane protein TolC [Deinococcus hopiensis KR-140]|uniref:Outer membrane protein TolC n=2 Tax=Deinococcus TaxID=1298 RepID=A0A1W1VQN3_9DEIO|nr:Outer membrane protein TolC [Deinococcus hopiensis KR-140]
MRSPPLVLLLSLALAGGSALAQTELSSPAPLPAAASPGPSSALSLGQVLTQLRGSPGWRSAELRYRSAELALAAAQARAGFNLSVGAEANAVKLPAASGETQLSATLTAQASIAVLPWSPPLEAVRQAQRSLLRAAAERRAAQATLTLNTVQAYWAARNAQEARLLADAQATLAGRQLQVAQAQRQAGVLPLSGLLAREQALSDAQARQREAGGDADLAARQLVNLLGQPVFLPTDPAAYGALPTEPQLPTAVDAVIARALSGRAEVTGAQNDLLDAQAGLQAARLDAGLPELNASVQYGQLGAGQSPAGWTVGASLNAKTGVLAGQARVPVRTPGEQPTGVTLALTASVPLVGGDKRVSVRSAEVAVQGTELALATARQSVELEVRQRQADLLTALDTLASRRGALRQAQEAQGTARARLAAGLVTALDVEDANLQLRQAALGEENARVQAFLASLRLAQSSAELDLTLLTAAPATPSTQTAPTPEARP